MVTGDQEELITLSEAAKLLGFTNVASVCNAIDRGKLTAVPRPDYQGEGHSTRLVRREEVERFRAERQQRLAARLAAIGGPAATGRRS